MCQKLLETRSVVLIFDLLGSVSGIEIVLKFAAVVDLVKCVGRVVGDFAITADIVAGGFFGAVFRWHFRREGFDLVVQSRCVLNSVGSGVVSRLKIGVLAVRVLVEDIVRNFLNLVTGLNVSFGVSEESNEPMNVDCVARWPTSMDAEVSARISR